MELLTTDLILLRCIVGFELVHHILILYKWIIKVVINKSEL